MLLSFGKNLGADRCVFCSVLAVTSSVFNFLFMSSADVQLAIARAISA